MYTEHPAHYNHNQTVLYIYMMLLPNNLSKLLAFIHTSLM